LVPADNLAAAIELDMAEWWTPTAQGFFSRVTKASVLKLVEENISREASKRLSKLKKGQMNVQAEKLFLETRWLPDPLRTPSAERIEEDDQNAKAEI
jgi:ParB family chromosome partitioning protein